MQLHLKAIKHIRPYLSETTASSLIRCLVLSRVDNCNNTLYCTTNVQEGRLQRLMNRSARIALNISLPNQLTHSYKNLQHLHWLPIKYRINFKIATTTFKTLTTSQPSYLRDLIIIQNNNKQLRSSSATTLIKHHTSTKIAQRAFSHSSPAVWNALPTYIRNSTSLSSFKVKLKTHYFQ